MKFQKDFLTSATCTYSVQVLVEVCAYSFEGGRNLFIGTDQHLENDCPQIVSHLPCGAAEMVKSSTVFASKKVATLQVTPVQWVNQQQYYITPSYFRWYAWFHIFASHDCQVQ